MLLTMIHSQDFRITTWIPPIERASTIHHPSWDVLSSSVGLRPWNLHQYPAVSSRGMLLSSSGFIESDVPWSIICNVVGGCTLVVVSGTFVASPMSYSTLNQTSSIKFSGTKGKITANQSYSFGNGVVLLKFTVHTFESWARRSWKKNGAW